MIGSGELLVIAVVAFLVLDPKDLKATMHKLGSWSGDFYRNYQRAKVEMNYYLGQHQPAQDSAEQVKQASEHN